jgi:hypothetical protein
MSRGANFGSQTAISCSPDRQRRLSGTPYVRPFVVVRCRVAFFRVPAIK